MVSNKQLNRVKMYTDIKYCSQKDVMDALTSLHQEDLKKLLDYTEFKDLFKKHAKEGEVTAFIRTLLAL